MCWSGREKFEFVLSQGREGAGFAVKGRRGGNDDQAICTFFWVAGWV
jgi:hypothetical protein